MIRLLVIVMTALAARTLVDASPPRHPNVILILSDDQRADTIAALGNDVIRTPTLDGLVTRGTTFTRAYCMGSRNGAVCLPSRCTIMTGRSLFRVDAWAEARRRDDIGLVPEAFRNAGYGTFAAGKWHAGEAWFLRCFESGRSVFFGGMGPHVGLRVWDVDADGSKRDRLIESYSSDAFASSVIDWIDQRDDDRPFFAHLSFTAPHDPRTPPPSVAYEIDDLTAPPNFLPVHPFDNGEMTIRDERLSPWPRSTRDVREQLARYYAMITHLDAQTGRVLDALAARGLLESTIVVFASDHGLALGSHGLLGKQNLYEHSMRSVLVVAGPGVPVGEQRETPVYLHDIGPTICRLAGVAPPNGVDGRDLLVGSPRDGVLTAYRNVQRAYTDGRWKVIRYPRIDVTQLFDLDRDPNEMHDLADDPAYRSRLDALLEQLARAQREAGDALPLTIEEPADPRFDHVAAEAARLAR